MASRKPSNSQSGLGPAALYARAPAAVSVEVSSRCNLSCIMCPRERLRRVQGDMEWETFDAVARMLRPIAPVDEFELSGYGEPLQRPDLLDAMLGRIEDWGLAPISRVSTNGTLMEPAVAEVLLRHPSLVLEVSVLAVRPQTYLLVTGQNLLSRVETNLEHLLARRRERGQTFPYVVVKSVRMGGLEGESKEFLERWEGLADEVRLDPYHRWGGVSPDLRGKSTQDRYPCPHLWRTLTVSSDGQVSPCDVDFDRRATVGHVSEGLDGLWNGDNLEQLRRLHMEGRWDEVSMCRQCDAWAKLPDPRVPAVEPPVRKAA